MNDFSIGDPGGGTEQGRNMLDRETLGCGHPLDGGTDAECEHIGAQAGSSDEVE